jgi:single-strand DNA-binding protein
MAHLNKVMLIGRLTDNPEPPRTLPNSGTTVVRFRFAASRGKKNPQTGQWENDPNPLYIDCDAFASPDSRRNLVDVISRYCQKGSQIYLEGRLQYETWDDKNNPGQKRSKHKIVVEDIQLLDRAPGGGTGGAADDMDAPPARSSFGGNRGGAPARGPAPRPNAGYSAGPDDMDGPPPAGGGNAEDIPF